MYKTGKKQYICGACASPTHLSVSQSDVERLTSNPRIQIFMVKIVQKIKNPAVTKDEYAKDPPLTLEFEYLLFMVKNRHNSWNTHNNPSRRN